MNPFFVLFAVGSVLAAVQRYLFGSHSHSPLADPNDDPFYRIPETIERYTNGDVISSRRVWTNIDDSYYRKSYQILYRTQNTAKQSDATVATIWTPKHPSKPTKLFSFQTFEDSAQLNCNPSWAFINSTASQNVITTTVDAPFYIQWALQRGYYVVAPDYLGSVSAFNAGFQEGYAILDALRATIKFHRLEQETQIVLQGYSGGGHATAWATILTGKYSPELNIIGASHGGTPVDTRGIYDFLMGSIFSGFAGAGLSGLCHAYPEFKEYLDELLTEEGRKNLEKVEARNSCLIQLVFSFPFKDFSTETFLKTIPLNDTIPSRILARESLLNENLEDFSIPNFPTFQYHAQLDEIVPRKDHETFIDQQCLQGAKVQYKIFPLQDHLTGVVFTIPTVLKALGQMYDGKLDVSKCGGPSHKSIVVDPDSIETENIMGMEAAKRLRLFNGKGTPLGLIRW